MHARVQHFDISTNILQEAFGKDVVALSHTRLDGHNNMISSDPHVLDRKEIISATSAYANVGYRAV